MVVAMVKPSFVKVGYFDNGELILDPKKIGCRLLSCRMFICSHQALMH